MHLGVAGRNGTSPGCPGGAGEALGAAGDVRHREHGAGSVTAPRRCLSGDVGALEGEPKAAERERRQGWGLPVPDAVPGERIRGDGLGSGTQGIVVLLTGGFRMPG